MNQATEDDEDNYPPNNLKKIRLARGLNQDDVANMVEPKTTKSQISKLEKRQIRMNDRWLRKLCKALKTTPNELLVTDASDTVLAERIFKPVDHDLMAEIARVIEKVATKRGMKMSKEEFLDVCVGLYNYVQDYRERAEHMDVNTAMVEMYIDLRARAGSNGG